MDAQPLHEGDLPPPPPGWWGRLPGMDALAHRRLPDAFRHAWAHWLQAGLQQLRTRHADWQLRDLASPPWCFVLGEGVIDGGAWIGVLMPSVDAAGRHGPFTVADAMAPAPSSLDGRLLARTHRWLERAAQCAADGLVQGMDGVRFDALLQQRFGAAAGDAGRAHEEDEAAARATGAPAALALPEFGQSLWFTDPAARGGQGMSTLGLPQDEQFDALFGFPAGDPAGDPGASP